MGRKIEPILNTFRFYSLLLSEISIITTWQSCRPASSTPWFCWHLCTWYLWVFFSAVAFQCYQLVASWAVWPIERDCQRKRMKTRCFAQVGLEPPRMPAQHHLLTPKLVCVCVCVCVFLAWGGNSWTHLGFESKYCHLFNVHIHIYVRTFSSFPKLPKASEPENGPSLSRLLFLFALVFQSCRPAPFFFLSFFFKTCMFFAFAFLGIARGILTELLFFVHLYSSSWCMYDHDAPTVVCLNFDQSRILDSNNLSNLPFDLFAENTALSQL